MTHRSFSLQARPMGEDGGKGVLGYATQLRDGSIVVIITRPGAKLGVPEEPDA